MAAHTAWTISRATYSTNVPTQNPYQADRPGRDAFVTKLNPWGNALVYSTYIGGNDLDEGLGIAVDSFGAASVIG